MKCPNCGADIPDNKLYCENCGAELQIVPDIDMDFDVENEMKNTLSNIAESEFSDEDYDEDYDDDYYDEDDDDDIDFDDDPNILSLILSGKAGGVFFYVIMGILLVAIAVAAIIFGHRVSEQKSLEYQLNKAEENINNNNLLSAISYLEEAYNIEKDPAYKFKIADYYYTLGRENDAIFTLMDVASGDFPKADREEAYNKIFTLYEAGGNYHKIAELLEDCQVESVKSMFADYAVTKPEFNYDAGTYEETIVIKITTEGTGTIHYTMDGTTPTVNSPVFDSPVFLEFGSYNIKAICENKFGEVSEVVEAKYLIDVDFVFEPIILTDSGEYHSATQIEADVPVMYNLYYTTDGTEPTRNSSKYTGPVQMPLGVNTFKFIAFAADGTQSTVVERKYDLHYDTDVTEGSALLALKLTLMEKGINEDLEGHRPGVDGNYLYVFTTAYEVKGQQDAFFIVEYYVTSTGVTTRTGTVFAVNVYNENDIYIVQPRGADYIRVEF